MTNLDIALKAETILAWGDDAPSGVTPLKVFIGPDPHGMGGFQVAVAQASGTPTRQMLVALHTARKGKKNISLVVAAVMGDRMWLLGPDEQTAVVELALGQGIRQLQSALDEPDSLAAYKRLGSLRRSIDSTSIPGFTNNGLFASYHVRENVPRRADWGHQGEIAKPLLGLRHQKLIDGLGFTSHKTVGNALVLSASTEAPRAVAILMDDTEQFDSKSPRFQLSPVAWGLNIAAKQGVPWLIVLRKDQIRLYPGKDGVGVGQKGQVETYFEIDLAAIDEDHAALLPLIFSADALEPNGTAKQLLVESGKYASQLGVRLRERVYEHVVPEIAKAVAKQLPQLGLPADADGLTIAYRLTLRLLFRLLFQAYAEDRGLLPAGRNERYDANSLKTIAQRDLNTDPGQFSSGAKSLWLDLVQVWNAIDEGNPLWEVPAYNGGLFGTDPELHPEGALINKLSLTDDVLGPALQHMLIDISEDGVRGPVDFRSLSVREFGTIYEGLLESSLSVTDIDLTLDKNGAWVPAKEGDVVEALADTAYFHSASGERKATGSYFTPSFVVDHLIDRSLDPALEAHLERIRAHLVAGDQHAATRDFFDFRVADLAMGSGHFLVAAVDRIEAKMRSFLADPETQVPGVNEELSRLADAARTALGKDETAIGEVEPTALLRRQIARRCIYGLDINPLAVELSRLALWIHTFVPGLPMSSLDHGLVCANSLTGIGTIDEALDALQPKRLPGQATFFDNVIEDNLIAAKSLLLDAANATEASKKEVRDGLILAQQAKSAAEPTKLIFDSAVAARTGAIRADGIFSAEELAVLSQSITVSEAVANLTPAHMPYLFPEVFIRDNPGFDALIGNPPFDKVKIDEQRWWGFHIPGLRALPSNRKESALKSYQQTRPELMKEYQADLKSVNDYRAAILKGPFEGLGKGGDPDLYSAFAWRYWQLLRSNGRFGIVLPRSALAATALAPWRREILRAGSFVDVTFLTNRANWVFEVHPQLTFALTVVQRGETSAVGFAGPLNNVSELQTAQSKLFKVPVEEFEAWTSNASFPLLPTKAAAAVFRQMKHSPNFSEGGPSIEFRPYAELHATNDKPLLEFDVEDTRDRIPVYGGSSFNIWDPDFGGPWAYVRDAQAFRTRMLGKLARRGLRSAYAGMEFPKGKLHLDYSRVAYRWITNQTNTRTTIVALLPPGGTAVNSAPVMVTRKGGPRAEAFLLGVMSSIPFDWAARRLVEGNLTFEVISDLPVPYQHFETALGSRIIVISGALAAIDDRYSTWASAVGVATGSVKSEATRADLIAELDALVTHAFGLSREDLREIFETFHHGWKYQSRLDSVLKHYDAWAENV